MAETAEQLARQLVETKQRNRLQLEAMASQLESLRVKRDTVAREIETLQRQVQTELEAQQRRQEEPTAPAAGGKPNAKATDASDANDDGMTLSDEQIADALANLLQFSATKSSMTHAR